MQETSQLLNETRYYQMDLKDFEGNGFQMPGLQTFNWSHKMLNIDCSSIVVYVLYNEEVKNRIISHRVG